ncbi:NAD(P)-binding protein [Actinoplanes sp. TBRC 11911]|uniref:hydroxysqualene dehydroxylase HpnE n=1 Tax=Actinoplanes sp. TBRC 11911 TaxID=2729386 RepID=UPI00145DCF5F|nr:hydroxysqualene dehydroxylase HpnE [Actinoplanes sp. TBRC 11911]NMO51126.1 NAD(P)-binding protein [Actinoplanes sp. TBRC 11911]
MTNVAVIGGGLAGIAAAVRAADGGARVTLFEGRPKLGGLTHSFKRGDLDIDNGQHVFLRCCTAYLGLLDRLGVTGSVYLQPKLAIPIVSPGQDPVWLRGDPLPAPLHLARSVLGYTPLTVLERLRFGTAALALRRVKLTAPATDEQSFGSWLAAHGQSRRAIETMWDLVGIATLNARADEASLALAAKVFQTGLLTDSDAADIGWSLVPLGELHGTASQRVLSGLGVTVHTSAKVTAVRPAGTGWDVDGQRFDQVVSAVPPDVAAKLLPEGVVPAGGELGTSPIVNVHVVYDRRVLDEPFVATIDSPLQWVFDRTSHSGLTEGQYIAVSLSAADQLIDVPVADLRERMLPALEALLPAARGAEVRDFFVTRERHATFRSAPGTAKLRPPAATALPGLWLAGAWTDTGWPATMEGAVRSGETAAHGLLHHMSTMSTLDGVAP